MCFMRSDFYCSNVAEFQVALCKKILDPLSVPYGPLRNWMIENDSNTSASRVLDHDLQAFPQGSYSLLSTSVRLALFNCSHSCRLSQSLGCAVNDIARALLLIAVHWHVFRVALAAPLGTARNLQIFAPLRSTALANVFPRGPAPTEILISAPC